MHSKDFLHSIDRSIVQSINQSIDKSIDRSLGSINYLFRVRSFRGDLGQDQWTKIKQIIVRQKTRSIHSSHGSFDVPWSEWSRMTYPDPDLPKGMHTYTTIWIRVKSLFENSFKSSLVSYLSIEGFDAIFCSKVDEHYTSLIFPSIRCAYSHICLFDRKQTLFISNLFYEPYKICHIQIQSLRGSRHVWRLVLPGKPSLFKSPATAIA